MKPPFVSHVSQLSIWAAAVTLCGAVPGPASSTEALHPLRQQNGPWMVLVKAFRGPQAVELANELVLELRRDYKIHAYTLTQLSRRSQAVQPAGLVRGRVRRYDEAAVLAGDFQNLKDAKKLRDKIRKLKPKSIPNKADSWFPWNQGTPRAICVPNPLRPPPKRRREADPFLLKLNSGKYSLYDCPGNYSLRVFSYRGGVAYTDEQWKRVKENSLLQAAGESAEQITRELRRQGHEAYVYHSRSASFVYVGGFVSPKDPRIVQMAQQLAGKRVFGFTLLNPPFLVPVPQR